MAIFEIDLISSSTQVAKKSAKFIMSSPQILLTFKKGIIKSDLSDHLPNFFLN